jgi:cytochrome c oxidase subunit 1
MTLTATRPSDAPAPAAEIPVLLPETWLTTSDHKRLGRMYVVASVVFLLVGVGVGLAMEAERAGKGVSIVGSNYARLFNLHSTVTTLLFLAPLWAGLATYLVPLQIGARRLAFPRLASMAFWTYVTGGLLLVASYTFGVPSGGGIVLSQPLAPLKGGATRATDLWAASLIVVTVASVLAAANLFTTILKLRADGMTLGRVPAFTWTVLMTSAATLLSAPMFAAGVLLVYLDQHFGGQLFAPSQGNANLVWQHLVWLYGRPDAYLLFLPALGVISDVVATQARRPLFMAAVVKGAIVAFAVLSFGILAANVSDAQAVLLPTPTLVSAFLVAPAGLCLLLWLGTVRPTDLRLHVSLLYVAGFTLLCLFGALNAIIAAFEHLSSESAWSTGQLHAVLFGAPTLAAFAGLYHWAPKVWGRQLNAALGALQWGLLFVGFTVSAAGSWMLGYAGAPWRVADLTGPASKPSWLALARLAGVGGVLVSLGIVVFVINLALTWFGSRSGSGPSDLSPGDPYDGMTLEWATTSPPPEDNFIYVPEIRSGTPLTDLREDSAQASAATPDGGRS